VPGGIGSTLTLTLPHRRDVDEHTHQILSAMPALLYMRRMHVRHRFRLGAVGLALAVLTAACGGAGGSGSSDGDIEIVTALPFSGGLAEIGQDM
jgi:hypothetical protein